VSKSLSTIQEFVTGYAGVSTLGNVGWQDSFRANMYRYGWAEIKKHPLIGKGFKFSTEEIIASMSYTTVNAFDLGSVTALAISGGYHNAVFELAVFCGLPTALIFIIAYFGILLRFLPWCQGLPSSSLKVLSAGMLGFFVQASGQMLMNGSGYMFGIICTLLGCMSGLMLHNPKGVAMVAPDINSPMAERVPIHRS
jgi:hypothetical protein